MDNKKLDEKLDKISDHLSSIDVTLGRQAVSLEVHVKRCDLLEEHINLVKLDVEESKDNWKLVSGGLRVIGFLAVICGAFEGIVALLEYTRLK